MSHAHLPVMYGISNCDTVRRARRWMDQAGHAYHFHDLRRDGLDTALVQRWLAQLGHEQLLNRRGRTWRELPAASREALDIDRAAALMLAHPAIIRRPVLEYAGKLIVGFDQAQWTSLFED